MDPQEAEHHARQPGGHQEPLAGRHLPGEDLPPGQRAPQVHAPQGARLVAQLAREPRGPRELQEPRAAQPLLQQHSGAEGGGEAQAQPAAGRARLEAQPDHKGM